MKEEVKTNINHITRQDFEIMRAAYDRVLPICEELRPMFFKICDKHNLSMVEVVAFMGLITSKVIGIGVDNNYNAEKIFSMFKVVIGNEHPEITKTKIVNIAPGSEE